MGLFIKTRGICGFLIAIVLMGTGCVGPQLRRSTVAQSTTLSDLYTQQVLDNVAMFVQNPDALPYFAFPNQGTTSIHNIASMNGLGYVAPNFLSSPFNISGSHSDAANWVLVPLSDPMRLALMRCAYRQAMAPCLGADPTVDSKCPDCRKLRTIFEAIPQKTWADIGAKGNACDCEIDKAAMPCLNSQCCWFCWGCKKHVPKHCQPPYVGSYGGVYVWVPPEGREMLTRLTLAILRYATSDMLSKRSKTVNFCIDEHGKVVRAQDAYMRVSATLPIDEPSIVLRAFELPKYQQFLHQFGENMPAELMRTAGSPPNNAGVKRWDSDYWTKNGPWETDKHNNLLRDKRVWANEREEAAARFLREHEMVPWEIPSDETIRSPKGEQQGGGTQGLQQLYERLEAVGD